MNAIAQKLESIVGTDSVVEWENIDAALRERSSAEKGACLVYPNTSEQLAEVVATAYQHRWALLPCGGGSKLHWGGVPTGIQLIVSTARLNTLIDRAVGDLTVTVEAGMKLASLQNILASAGQFLAIDSAYPDLATVGGTIATGNTGSWRQRYGGVRDQVLGISFVRADGQVAKAGGRVVKNVAGYDLMKLFTGSYGTLGIVSQVTFRVYPKSLASGTVVLTGNREAIAKVTQTLIGSELTPTAADVLSPDVVKQLNIGGEMGSIARFQSGAESVEEQSTRLLEIGEKLGLKSSRYADADEDDLWQRLTEIMQESDRAGAIACKIGVRPTEAVATLAKFDELTGGSGVGQIHASSGLGGLRFDCEDAKEQVLQMRQVCQSNGGFLTILSAPVEVKQQLDVWGYTGNALELMRKIKKQFDPENILSPNRFVAGI